MCAMKISIVPAGTIIYEIDAEFELTNVVAPLSIPPGSYVPLVGVGLAGDTVSIPTVAPSNTSLPVATGAAQVGQVVTTTDGVWGGHPGTPSYQWLRGTTAISGANSASYTPVTGDIGSTLACRVTLTNAAGAVSATSLNTAAVVGPSMPVNSALPTITGTAQEGQTLTASTGTWTNSPSGFAYQWLRGGVAISGATASTYALGAAEVGAAITVQVIASNAGGASAPATSAATATVAAAAPSLFAFELLNEAGSGTITAVPNLRIQLGGAGPWHTLASASAALGATLTIARGADGKSLVISGWPGGVIPAGTLFHYEKRLPGETNNAAATTAANLPALYFRRLGGPAPINTTVPGWEVAPTRAALPIGVTP